MSRILSRFISHILPWLVLAHSLLFVLFWLTNSLFYASSNDFLANMLGKRLDYVRLLIWVSVLIALWSCARGILSRLHKTHPLSSVTCWIFGFVALLYIIFFYASFALLFSKSPVQLVRIGQLLGYYRLVLDALLLLGFAVVDALVILPMLLRQARTSAGWLPWVVLVVVYLAVWIIPLVYPPASILNGALPAKPRLIAHRGASMLAPENTNAAARLAAEIGVYGLETDVHVSQDGQLFLMHDDTFDRTTDVASVFPGRQKEPVENFTLAEIRQLNAGSWFVRQDPFHAIRKGLITSAQVQDFRQQPVPLLTDWLTIVQAHHLAFRYDLKQPANGHPYAASFFELTLRQVHAAGVDSQVWILADPAQLPTLNAIGPEMIPTYGADYQHLPSAAELKALGYQVVNVEYGISPTWIRQYRQANLWVDVYTVDEAWQFSRLWLLRVDSVTTSNAGVMAALTRPVFSFSWTQYLLIWSLVGLVGLGFGVGCLTYLRHKLNP